MFLFRAIIAQYFDSQTTHKHNSAVNTTGTSCTHLASRENKAALKVLQRQQWPPLSFRLHQSWAHRSITVRRLQYRPTPTNEWHTDRAQEFCDVAVRRWTFRCRRFETAQWCHLEGSNIEDEPAGSFRNNRNQMFSDAPPHPRRSNSITERENWRRECLFVTATALRGYG